MDGIWKIAKGLSLFRISTLSKKAQDKEVEIKKLYETNKWWNYWKFQLHWHKLELVSQEVKLKGINPIQFLQINFT